MLSIQKSYYENWKGFAEIAKKCGTNFGRNLPQSVEAIDGVIKKFKQLGSGEDKAE